MCMETTTNPVLQSSRSLLKPQLPDSPRSRHLPSWAKAHASSPRSQRPSATRLPGAVSAVRRAVRFALFLPPLHTRISITPSRSIATPDRTAPRLSNGPDECAAALGATKCAAIQRNREGSLELRLLITESIASAGSVVPFYFQPTLGGSDINGNPGSRVTTTIVSARPTPFCCGKPLSTPSGAHRFHFRRRPGQSRARARRYRFQPSRSQLLRGTYAARGRPPGALSGLCLGRAGGPHTIANVNNSLLGGSARPSLF
jgi:hypothetical protein